MPDSIQQSLEVVRGLLSKNLASRAEEAMRSLLAAYSVAEIASREAQVRTVIDQFLKNRKRDLTAVLDKRLQSGGAAPVAKGESGVDYEALGGRVAERLRELSDHHIYAWSTYYRDTVVGTFHECLKLVRRGADLEQVTRILREAYRVHSREIFRKGWDYLAASDVPEHIRLTKAVNGLGKFAELPVQAFSDQAFESETAGVAFYSRQLCSSILLGILQGFGELELGGVRGYDQLVTNLRVWFAHVAFMTAEDATHVFARISLPELNSALKYAVAPTLSAIDHLMRQQSGQHFCLPRAGVLGVDRRALSIAVSLPADAVGKSYFEVHAYLSLSDVARPTIELAEERGVDIVVCSVSPEARAWYEATEERRIDLIDCSVLLLGGPDAEINVRERVQDSIQRVLRRNLGSGWEHRAIAHNHAKDFPLEDRKLRRQMFLVHRDSVQSLLQKFEQDTGVRLWCSVRRSGKTTACSDLSSVKSQTSIVIQTTDAREEEPGRGVLYSRMNKALEEGRMIPANFLKTAVAECMEYVSSSPGAKIVLVIDEYETFFQRLRTAVDKDESLRYTVAQPLLSQLADFSNSNLLLLVGQKPDSHAILMDQNQLSPLVKQDAFPLFQHAAEQLSTEFTRFLKRVVSNNIVFDLGFANAVYAETAGHPYLTVNVMVDFFDWMIANGRAASEQITERDFKAFSDERLKPDALRRANCYGFFGDMISEGMSAASRERTPWLYAVFAILGRMARDHPVRLSYALPEYRTVATEAAANVRLDPDYLLRSAQMANFLILKGGNVRPAIPIMARIAGVTMPRIH